MTLGMDWKKNIFFVFFSKFSTILDLCFCLTRNVVDPAGLSRNELETKFEENFDFLKNFDHLNFWFSLGISEETFFPEMADQK